MIFAHRHAAAILVFGGHLGFGATYQKTKKVVWRYSQTEYMCQVSCGLVEKCERYFLGHPTARPPTQQ
jgi:hypothetical protein